MSKEKQVVTKQETSVVKGGQYSTLADLGMTANDITIPRLLLMQNTSEYVGDGKAKLGDFINSQTLEIVGGVEKPLDVVPLKFFKNIRVMDVSEGQPKLKRIEPWTQSGEDKPWDGIEDGKPVRRYLAFNFFVLLYSDLENEEAFPVVLSFKSTNLSQAGKPFASAIFKRSLLGQAIYGKTIKVAVKRVKKESNTWAVNEVLSGKDDCRKLNEAQLGTAMQWVAMLETMKVTIADEDAEEEGSTTTHAAAPKPVVVEGLNADEEY